MCAHLATKCLFQNHLDMLRMFSGMMALLAIVKLAVVPLGNGDMFAD